MTANMKRGDQKVDWCKKMFIEVSGVIYVRKNKTANELYALSR